ncbi:hypothetical protein HDR58_01620 [bacterium]|nr:hypothetical protein [bacterium]
MKGSKILATLVLSAMLFTGCGLKDQKAVIKVGDGVITQKQYDELMDKSIAQSPLAQFGDMKGNKDGFLYLMTEQRVINQLIIQEILNQEAKSRGIKVSNKDVDEAVKKIMDKMGGRDKLTEVLKQNGISIGEFKKDVRNQVKMQKLAEAAGKIKVTDADCKAFYDKNPDKFKHDDQVRASHILIAANDYQLQQEIDSNPKKKLDEKELKAKVEKALQDKKAEAEKLAKELQTDNSKFAAYAKKYSEDPGSAQQGGDLGFFAKDRMVPEFAEAAFKAKPNTVTDPVKSQFGYHIIMVTDRRAAGIMPYEKVKSDIKDFLVNEKQIEALDKLTVAAKKKVKIEYVDENFNPEVIDKKLKKQVNDATNGQAEKVREATMKDNKKK